MPLYGLGIITCSLAILLFLYILFFKSIPDGLIGAVIRDVIVIALMFLAVVFFYNQSQLYENNEQTEETFNSLGERGSPESKRNFSITFYSGIQSSWSVKEDCRQ